MSTTTSRPPAPEARRGLFGRRTPDDGQALAIFVQPPSLAILKERLTGRGTDTIEKLQERFIKAEKELNYAPQFDIILKNHDLETACKEAENLVRNFLTPG